MHTSKLASSNGKLGDLSPLLFSLVVRPNVWDIDNPETITLPCANPNEQHEVKCIACVEDRIWVGAGPSIFLLNAEHPEIREVGVVRGEGSWGGAFFQCQMSEDVVFRVRANKI